MNDDGHRKEAGMGIPRKMPIVELVKLLVRARYEKYLPPKKKAIIIKAGQKYGLIDGQERRTAKYFVFLDGEIEQLARELTGHSKQPERPCPCGCGKHGESSGISKRLGPLVLTSADPTPASSSPQAQCWLIQWLPDAPPSVPDTIPITT